MSFSDPAFWHQYGSYLVPILVVLFIARRSFKAQRVKTTGGWVRPGLFLVLTLFVLAQGPFPSLLAIGGFVAAAAAGAGLGYMRAAHQTLTLDPTTGEITSKATPLGSIIFTALFLARYVLQMMTNARDVPHALGLQRASEAGLIFATVMMGASRLELWRRTQPLIAEHRERSVTALPEAASAVIDQSSENS